MKLEISRQIFEKYSNIRFHENPSSGIRVFQCGRRDRHDEAHSLLFGILATHLKMYCVIYPYSYPVSIFKKAYHKLLGIKIVLLNFLGRFPTKSTAETSEIS